MTHPPLDDATADRLLAGAVRPDDAPAGYAEVAALLAAARGPVSAEEASFPVILPAVAPVIGLAGRRARSGRRLASRVGVIAAVATVGFATVAAATGNLPGPAQDALARAGERIGLSLPASSDTPADPATPPTSGTPGSTRPGTPAGTRPDGQGTSTTFDAPGEPPTSAVGVDLAPGSPALPGVCNAYLRGLGEPNGVSFRTLEVLAAGSAEQAAVLTPEQLRAAVVAYCGIDDPGLPPGQDPSVTTPSDTQPPKPSNPPSSKVPAPPSSKVPAPPSSKVPAPPSSKVPAPPSSKVPAPPTSKDATAVTTSPSTPANTRPSPPPTSGPVGKG
jgi:hypothetical protein